MSAQPGFDIHRVAPVGVGGSRHPASRDTSPSLEVAGWAVLTLDGLRLALPQRDMVTLELSSVLAANPLGNVEIGTFAQKNRTWPAYALDAALALQAAGVTRRLCAFFKTAGQVRGLLCDAFSLLPADGDLVAEPLPGCMVQTYSPITGYALRENQVIAATSAQTLGAYLEHLLEKRHVATV